MSTALKQLILLFTALTWKMYTATGNVLDGSGDYGTGDDGSGDIIVDQIDPGKDIA